MMSQIHYTWRPRNYNAGKWQTYVKTRKVFENEKRLLVFWDKYVFVPSFQYCQNTPIRAVPLIIRACAVQYFDFLKISHCIQMEDEIFLKMRKGWMINTWRIWKEIHSLRISCVVPILQFEWWTNSSGKMYQQEGIAHMRSISYFAKNIVSGLNCLSCWKGSASIVSSVHSSSRHISRLFATRNNINGWGKNTRTVLFQKKFVSVAVVSVCCRFLICFVGGR
jgi:hypothetical protein